MLNGINKLFNRILQEIKFGHFHLLILLNPRLDSIQPRMIKLLRLNKHRNPLILLPLQVFHYGLIINQMLFVLREILCAHILYLLELFIVLDIDVVVVFINI